MSVFGGTHVTFGLMMTCAVRRYGFLLSALPPDICRQYLAAEDRAVHTAIFQVLGVSHDVQTLDQLNCANRQFPLSAEFKGFNVPSLELNDEHAHYASFNATPANMINDCESESLGPMYDLIRQEQLNVATSTSQWVVQLRSSYETISTMGGFRNRISWCRLTH
jgi:hypothetical protein